MYRLLGFILVSTAAAQALEVAGESVTLTAVGDISLDGPVGRLMAKYGNQYPLKEIRRHLKGDIVLGNLECSVTQRGEKQEKTWNFRAPPKRLGALKDAGFSILNLANNHSMDYGVTGFNDTLAALRKLGLSYIGGGKNISEAEKLKVVRKNGLRLGFLGFTSTFPQQAWARKTKPGVAYSDFERFPGIIRKAKNGCDVLIVSFHGGTELAAQPNDIQKDFAHLAVKAGADLVVGHHPHVLQAVEIYEGKPIVYSLGNFLFVSPSTATHAAVIAKAAVTATRKISPGGAQYHAP